VALSAKGRPSARRIRHLLRVRYRPARGIREELEALAGAERQCCSFAEWRVTQKEDHVILQVAADPERPNDIAAIAALFEAD
jgi:hypothetical protein